jgi:hypothetical protein
MTELSLGEWGSRYRDMRPTCEAMTGRLRALVVDLLAEANVEVIQIEARKGAWGKQVRPRCVRATSCAHTGPEREVRSALGRLPSAEDSTVSAALAHSGESCAERHLGYQVPSPQLLG